MSGGIVSRLKQLISPAPKNGDAEPAAAAPAQIRLVVGLGNPGGEYAGNRHNVGYWVINRLARRHGIELETSGEAQLGQGAIGGQTVALAKPRTFVNRSGVAVWNLIRRLGLDDARELLVVYDDLDLPLGKLRLRSQGGHGGYKGLQSIIEATGSDHFARLRIGIGRPVANGEPSFDPDVVANYVLSDPPPQERDVLDETVDRAIEAIELALAEGLEPAMQRYN